MIFYNFGQCTVLDSLKKFSLRCNLKYKYCFRNRYNKIPRNQKRDSHVTKICYIKIINN